MLYKWLFPADEHQYLVLRDCLVKACFWEMKNSWQMILLFGNVEKRKEKHSSIDKLINIKGTCFHTVLGSVQTVSLPTKRRLSLPPAYAAAEALVCKEGVILARVIKVHWAYTAESPRAVLTQDIRSWINHVMLLYHLRPDQSRPINISLFRHDIWGTIGLAPGHYHQVTDWLAKRLRGGRGQL